MAPSKPVNEEVIAWRGGAHLLRRVRQLGLELQGGLSVISTVKNKSAFQTSDDSSVRIPATLKAAPDNPVTPLI